MAATLVLWAKAIETIAQLHGRTISARMVIQTATWSKSPEIDTLLGQISGRLGLTYSIFKGSVFDVPARALPVIAELQDDGLAIVTAIGIDQVSFVDISGTHTLERALPKEGFAKLLTGKLVAIAPRAHIADGRLSKYLGTYRPAWFRELMFADKRQHVELGIGSFVANLLALAGSIFSMQVWDRVVPAQSLATLWVLALGVFMAIAMELILRIARVEIADRMGKKVDHTISSMVFSRALDIRSDARPKSTGAFISQLREIETIRETLASTTITAAIDIPFAITFLAVIWLIAGNLVWVVVAMLPLIIIPGALLQIPLAKLSTQGARDSALRQAILVESIEGVEDIKLLQAEARFSRQWDQYSIATSNIALQQRKYVSIYIYWISAVQQISYVAIIIAGVYFVLAGELTTGAVIGASILSSRALSPFVQFAQIFTKWQGARTARKGLDDLLQKPLDHGGDTEKLRRHTIYGEYTIAMVEYGYDQKQAPNIKIDALQINAGEKVAIIGRNGAGKSTLLKLLANMMAPHQGEIRVDGENMVHIDQSDIRRNIALQTQDSRLFFGSVLENIKVGAPLAKDKALAVALQVSGAGQVIKGLSKGMETAVLEGGGGLSGGQKQSIILARTLLRDTAVVLLDEPSAALDEGSEKTLVKSLGVWLKDRTLIMATHRSAMLELVDRVIVMEKGKIVLDGSKEEVMASLQGVPMGPAVGHKNPAQGRAS